MRFKPTFGVIFSFTRKLKILKLLGCHSDGIEFFVQSSYYIKTTIIN